jgi:hypothetical protein
MSHICFSSLHSTSASVLPEAERKQLKTLLIKPSKIEAKNEEPTLHYCTFSFLKQLRTRLNQKGIFHSMHLQGRIFDKIYDPTLPTQDHTVMIYLSIPVNCSSQNLAKHIHFKVDHVCQLTRACFEECINDARKDAKLSALTLKQVADSYFRGQKLLNKFIDAKEPSQSSGNRSSFWSMGKKQGKKFNCITQVNIALEPDGPVISGNALQADFNRESLSLCLDELLDSENWEKELFVYATSGDVQTSLQELEDKQLHTDKLQGTKFLKAFEEMTLKGCLWKDSETFSKITDDFLTNHFNEGFKEKILSSLNSFKDPMGKLCFLLNLYNHFDHLKIDNPKKKAFQDLLISLLPHVMEINKEPALFFYWSNMIFLCRANANLSPLKVGKYYFLSPKHKMETISAFFQQWSATETPLLKLHDFLPLPTSLKNPTEDDFLPLLSSGLIDRLITWSREDSKENVKRCEKLSKEISLIWELTGSHDFCHPSLNLLLKLIKTLPKKRIYPHLAKFLETLALRAETSKEWSDVVLFYLASPIFTKEMIQLLLMKCPFIFPNDTRLISLYTRAIDKSFGTQTEREPCVHALLKALPFFNFKTSFSLLEKLRKQELLPQTKEVRLFIKEYLPHFLLSNKKESLPSLLSSYAPWTRSTGKASIMFDLFTLLFHENRMTLKEIQFIRDPLIKEYTSPFVLSTLANNLPKLAEKDDAFFETTVDLLSWMEDQNLCHSQQAIYDLLYVWHLTSHAHPDPKIHEKMLLLFNRFIKTAAETEKIRASIYCILACMQQPDLIEYGEDLFAELAQGGKLPPGHDAHLYVALIRAQSLKDNLLDASPDELLSEAIRKKIFNAETKDCVWLQAYIDTLAILDKQQKQIPTENPNDARVQEIQEKILDRIDDLLNEPLFSKVLNATDSEVLYLIFNMCYIHSVDDFLKDRRKYFKLFTKLYTLDLKNWKKQIADVTSNFFLTVKDALLISEWTAALEILKSAVKLKVFGDTQELLFFGELLPYLASQAKHLSREQLGIKKEMIQPFLEQLESFAPLVQKGKILANCSSKKRDDILCAFLEFYAARASFDPPYKEKAENLLDELFQSTQKNVTRDLERLRILSLIKFADGYYLNYHQNLLLESHLFAKVYTYINSSLSSASFDKLGQDSYLIFHLIQSLFILAENSQDHFAIATCLKLMDQMDGFAKGALRTHVQRAYKTLFATIHTLQCWSSLLPKLLLRVEKLFNSPADAEFLVSLKKLSQSVPAQSVPNGF